MSTVKLGKDANQALGLGQFAIDFLAEKLGPGPSAAVLERAALFHADAVLCGLSALALRTNAPTLLRKEAFEYPDAQGATPFGSSVPVKAEKAIVANSAAVREWDSNGTNFGYNPALGNVAGEFGHNDFYPVVIAACQQRSLDGATALRAMVLLDEIRGRLAEVFSLKSYKIDHVVHGAIASAATYGVLMGATAEQIESAIGMFVAHYIPWRAIRAGKQLSDSKGASAAISTEAAILSMRRSMAGFVGPKDIFRNPESLFRQFERTAGDSPFDLVLSHSGDDFAVMGMHFKIGLYEHQSAGALQGIVDLVSAHPEIKEPGEVDRITIRAYEPAFGIIGDPAKRDPHTRQSADHSMVYIVASFLHKAIKLGRDVKNVDLWKSIMLLPEDYARESLHNAEVRELMSRIAFEHGGPEYDAKYPDGIPTSVVITTVSGATYDSGLVMYPLGHARSDASRLKEVLSQKFFNLGRIAFPSEAEITPFVDRLTGLGSLNAGEIRALWDFEIADRPGYE